MNYRTGQIYEFGPFRLDPAERLLWQDGVSLSLPPKVYDTLLALVTHEGHLLTKDELMKAVWPDTFVEENNLTVNISALRKALGESHGEPRYIETVPRMGYRFVAEVRSVTAGEESGCDQAGAIAQEAMAAERPGKRRSGVAGHLALAAVVVAALILALSALFGRGRHLAPPSPINSLVVLPLANLSSDPAQEYFADGMTDALIGELAKIGALRVISRTSAMYYKGSKRSLPEIARELKVEAVVEGTVLRSADRVRVRAQLIRAATDEHLWAETYDRDLRDVLGLQSEIARAIAREIQIKLTPAEQARLTSARQVNRKAFDDDLQGRYHRNQMTKEHLRQGVEYFQSAIKEDPAYAPAYAGLAESYNSLGTVMVGGLPAGVARARAAEAAEKALAIESDLAAAHAALAVVKHYDWEWAEAEREFKRAIDLNPSYAPARAHYAIYLSTLGRAEEALAEITQARQLDPLSLPIRWNAGFLFYEARRYDEAVEHLRHMIQTTPDFHHAYWVLGYAYLAKGKVDEAMAVLEKAAAPAARDQAVLTALGRAYGLAGRRAEAYQLLKELTEIARREYVPPVAFVDIHVGLGNWDLAFAWLEKAYQERSNYMAHLKVLPEVDSLRSDPRFEDLVRRIGLAP